MKNLKSFNVISISLLFILISAPIHANEFDISDQKYNEINARVNSMSINELNARIDLLKAEEKQIEQNLKSGASLDTEDSNMIARRKEILAEMSSIQKVLIGIAGLGV